MADHTRDIVDWQGEHVGLLSSSKDLVTSIVEPHLSHL